jgi:glyceraldehyde 3-phosphate dehydrogenase
MSLQIAITGIGRIGRSLIRLLDERPEIELCAVNDVAPPEQWVRLLERDTFLGPFSGRVDFENGSLRLDDRMVAVHNESDPAAIPWGDSGARLVVEATGLLTEGTAAQAHIGDGVERVILSANSALADATICYGVNHQTLTGSERVISNASCTTNCLAVVAHVLDRAFGIEHALLNTVHCYNNSQPLTDAPHGDPRRARAAGVNMIPTTTGASSAIGRVLPGLGERMDGFAVRVPSGQVSMIDLIFQARSEPSIKAINEAFSEAAQGDLDKVLSVTEKELVSTDFIGDTHSAIVDLPLTQVVGGRLVRVVAWYDNETGYASRVLDLATWLTESGQLSHD